MRKHKCPDCGWNVTGKDETNHWRFLILEAYCFRRGSNTCQRSKHFYKFIEDEKGNWVKDKNGMYKTEKVPNKCYVPGTRMPRKPKWCPNHVCFTCYMKNCKFLATTVADIDVHKKLDKVI
jgi:hypothetical protein